MIDLENPELLHWQDDNIKCECWGVSPEYKHALMIDYAGRLGLTQFVETGTWCGDTVEAVRSHFDTLYSIELSPELFERSAARFIGCQNIHLYCGDSGIVLKDILSRINKKPTLFWLDAHSSGRGTVGIGTPLEKELTAILESGIKGAILIDDLQDFWGHGWGDLARKTVVKYDGWQQEIKHGIMRVTHAS